MSEISADYDEALRLLSRSLAGREDYAVIGGLAVSFRGIPRLTADIDLLLALPRIRLPEWLESLARAGFSLDVPSTLAALRDAHLAQIRFRGIRIDLLSALLPAFVQIVRAASPEEICGHPLRVASAEALLFLKLIAFRPQDQADILGLLATHPDGLDLELLARWYGEIGETTDARWQFLAQAMRDKGGERK